jgi:hypothetical protein
VGGGSSCWRTPWPGSIAFQDRWIDPLLGDGLSDTFARMLRDGSIVVVVIMTALVLRVELRSQRPSCPRMPTSRRLGHRARRLSRRDPFLFLVLWSVQHWSAAMGLASLAAFRRGPRRRAAHWQRLLAPINRRGWAVLLVLAVAVHLLLPVLEVEAVTTSSLRRPHFRRGGAVAPLLTLRAGAAAHWASRPASFTTCWIARPSASRHPTVRQAARGLLK